MKASITTCKSKNGRQVTVDGLLTISEDEVRFVSTNSSFSIPSSAIFAVYKSPRKSDTSLLEQSKIKRSLSSLSASIKTSLSSVSVNRLSQQQQQQQRQSNRSSVVQGFSTAPTSPVDAYHVQENTDLKLSLLHVPSNKDFNGRQLISSQLLQLHEMNLRNGFVDSHQPFDLVVFGLRWKDFARPVSQRGQFFCLRLSVDCDLDALVKSTRRLFNLIKKDGFCRNAMVIVNPFSGTKQAMQIYRSVIRPMFELAQLHYTLIKTERAGHADDIARTFTVPSPLDAVVICGGDGIVNEFVNGLMSRTDDRQLALQIPIGYVPGGSGNALAKNIDCQYAEHAVLNIIQMHSRPLDLFSYRYLEQPLAIRYGFLELMWGLIADIDIESERIRWAGNLRFTLWAILRVIRLRQYHGQLLLLENGNKDMNQLDFKNCESLLHDGWIQVPQNVFSYFMAMNMPWCASDFLVAPDASISDGSLDLTWISSNSRGNILKLLLDTESGKYVQEQYVHRKKCKAFILYPGDVVTNGASFSQAGSVRLTSEPVTPMSATSEVAITIDPNYHKGPGVLDVDGEVIRYGPILVECLPKAALLIVPRDIK